MSTSPSLSPSPECCPQCGQPQTARGVCLDCWEAAFNGPAPGELQGSAARLFDHIQANADVVEVLDTAVRFVASHPHDEFFMARLLTVRARLTTPAESLDVVKRYVSGMRAAKDW